MNTENNKKSQLCDVCESEPADVACLECNRMHSFCKCCFDLSHRSPNKKTHVPKPLKNELLKLSADLSLQMYKCPIHPLEGLKYICSQCKTVACADCFAIGEHKKHIPMGFEEAAQEIISKFVTECEDAKRAAFKSKETYTKILSEKDKDYMAFKAFSETLKEQFKILHEALDKKMAILQGVVQNEANEISKYLIESEKNVTEITNRLDHRVKYLKETIEHIRKSISPENYHKYKELVPENLHKMNEETIDEIANLIENRDKLRVPPKLNLDKVFEAIGNLDFSQVKNVTTDASYYENNKELQIIFKSAEPLDLNGIYARAVDLDRKKGIGEEKIEKNKVTYKNYFLNKEKSQCRIFLGLPWNYLDCEIYKPAINFTAITKFGLKCVMPTESFTMLTRDCITGMYYLSNTFNSCKTLYEYESLADFLKGKLKRTIILEEPFDGWYIAVKNGLAIYNLSGTNRIAVTNLTNGKTIGICEVPYATCRNGTGTFSHRGYTDLAIFCDERTEKLYVVYETQDEQEFKITEICVNYDTGIPTLNSSWVIKGERKGYYAFGFIYNNTLYLGTSHKDLAIDRKFSLLDQKLSSTGVIQAVSNVFPIDVHFISFQPSDKTLICCMSEPYRICIFDMEN